MLRWDRIQTPAADGDVLVEPPLHDWPALIDAAREDAGRSCCLLAGWPLAEVAARTRAALRLPTDGSPVVASGHQPAFIHPGVWLKQVAARHSAAAVRGQCLDLVVDQDAPAAPAWIIPVPGEDGQVTVCRADPGIFPAGSPYEGRPMVEPAWIEALGEKLQPLRRILPETTLLDAYLAGLRATVTARPPTSVDFVDQHMAGRQAADALVAADLPRVRVSAAFGGPFLADLLLNADRFRFCYNEALAAYRRQWGLRKTSRPLPDLGREQDWIETALWIYEPLSVRRRLWVRRRGDMIDLRADGQPAATLGEADIREDLEGVLSGLRPQVIRPRALTLTLWARLLVCDLFVHGIGGAKYDRITDRILGDYYGCQGAPYACVSATLHLPLGIPAVPPEPVSSARHRLRDLVCNPHRHVAAPAELLAEREALVALSDRLRAERGDRRERHRVWQAIHQLNRRMLACEPGITDRLTAEVEALTSRWASYRVATSREYFYVMFPRHLLAALVERMQSA